MFYFPYTSCRTLILAHFKVGSLQKVVLILGRSLLSARLQDRNGVGKTGRKEEALTWNIQDCTSGLGMGVGRNRGSDRAQTNIPNLSVMWGAVSMKMCSCIDVSVSQFWALLAACGIKSVLSSVSKLLDINHEFGHLQSEIWSNSVGLALSACNWKI